MVDATFRLQTGYTGSQGHECNGVDRVLEEDEAAQVAGDIADECRAEGNHADGQDEGAVTAVEPWERAASVHILVVVAERARGTSKVDRTYGEGQDRGQSLSLMDL